MPTKVHRPTTFPLPRELVEQWAQVPASIAADVLEGLTLVDPAIRPLRPLPPGGRLVGSIVTALCEGTDYGAVHHAIAVAGPGDVILIEAGGRPNPAVIGELLSGAARRKGIAGVVVNGAVRDTGRLARWQDFVVFTRHITPRGPSSMDRGTVNDVIAFAGTRVAPHDLVIGDDDGLVVIPRAAAEARLGAALARVAAEEAWERELASGRTTLDVFQVPPAG
ncbi:RraA family protein [Benzoatithermus flavus]|uniref:Putative 4-hydroxy-4-methyl-2-oxoglutarate aldolase n=1 Tax=Benzoatithermus flavus TaxID=3108223 RepID=A0ABU8XLC3_9PROT